VKWDQGGTPEKEWSVTGLQGNLRGKTVISPGGNHFSGVGNGGKMEKGGHRRWPEKEWGLGSLRGGVDDPEKKRGPDIRK